MNVLWFTLGLLIGAVVELIVSTILEERFRTIHSHFRAQFARFRNAFTRDEVLRNPEFYRVGQHRVECVILEGSIQQPFRRSDISGIVADDDLKLPKPLRPLKDAVETTQSEIERKRGQPTFFNGPMVALSGWTRGRVGTLERPSVVAHLIPTDYYTFLATAPNLDEEIVTKKGTMTVRDYYISGRDYRDPNPVVATSLGVNLALVTRDNFMLFVRRGNTGLSNYLGRRAVPIGESVSPVLDLDERGHVDMFRTAIRGAQEELNLAVTEGEIHLYTMTLDLNYYFYGFSGAIFCGRLDRDDVVAHASRGSKDGWESRDPAFVRFEPDAVANFVREADAAGAFTPSSFVSLTQALIARYGADRVDAAFR